MAGLLFACRTTQHTTPAHAEAPVRASGLRAACGDLHDAARHRDIEPHSDDHDRAKDREPDRAATDIDGVADSVTKSLDPAVANADRGLVAKRAGSGSRVVLRGRRRPHAEPRLRTSGADVPRLDLHADRLLPTARSRVGAHWRVAA